MKTSALRLVLISFLALIGLLVVAAIGYLYVLFTGTPWERNAQKTAMLAHLTEKYQSDFKIKKVTYSPGLEAYLGYAYPAGHPEAEFEVQQVYEKRDQYTDKYALAIWDTSLSKPLKQGIIAILPDIIMSTFVVQDLTSEHFAVYRPTYREIGATAYMVAIKITIPKDWFEMSEEHRTAERQKIEQLSRYLQEHHFPVLTEISYSDSEPSFYERAKVFFILENGEIADRKER